MGASVTIGIAEAASHATDDELKKVVDGLSPASKSKIRAAIPAGGKTTYKPYLTPEKILSRWFALISGTLTTTAGSAIASMSFLLGSGTGTIKDASLYTVAVLVAFTLLGVIFYRHKNSLDAASKDEEKDGLTGLSPSELLSLAVDEGIQNITGAMASILAQVWFQLLPWADGFALIPMVQVGGSVILVLGELIQRRLTKGRMAEYIVNMLNGLNVGSVSWFLGFALSNTMQNALGAPDGESSKVDYWMFCVALAFAGIVMQLVNFLSAKLCKSSETRPYGTVIFSAFKGTPMYVAAWVLNNIVQYRYDGEYIVGTFVWITISTLVVIGFDQLLHIPGNPCKLKPGSRYADDAKLVHHFTTQMVSLLGQIFAFVCGQLASFAMSQYFPNATDAMWIFLAVVFQVLGFLVESARTRCLPRFFKDVDAREYQVLAGA